MRRLVICVVALILILTFGWLSYTTYVLWRDPNTLPVKKVQVEGHFRYISRATLEQAVLPFVENGFLHVDVVALRKRLLEFLPVKDVRIVRIWPDKLWMEVVEHHFVARWREPTTQSIWLVNDKGVALPISPNASDNALLLLIGSSTQIKRLLQISQEIEGKLAPIGLHIKELKIDKRYALQAKLDNEIELILGRDTALARVQRFAQVYEKLTPKISGKMSYIDLRYTNGIAVKIDK